jgi:hypothetical protein
MSAVLSRRQLLHGGGVVIAAALAGPPVRLGAQGSGGTQRADPVWIVAADIPQAWDIARALCVRAERIIPLSGDPVRFWRGERARLSGGVAGVTRWSDFLLLRELAYEQRWRVRSETHHSSVDGPLLVSFRLA